MIKGVIFDLDDTLYPEKEFSISGFDFVSKYISRKKKKKSKYILDMLISLFLEKTDEVFNRLIKNNKEFEIFSVKELVNVYRNHTPNISLYKDAESLINYLKKNKYKLGIITDGFISVQKKKIKALHLDKIIDEIIYTDEYGRENWKPSPLGFKIIKDRINLEYDELVYIGDNPRKDFYINKLLGIKTIRLLRDGFNINNEYYENIKENFRINNFFEVIEIINKIDKGKI